MGDSKGVDEWEECGFTDEVIAFVNLTQKVGAFERLRQGVSLRRAIVDGKTADPVRREERRQTKWCNGKERGTECTAPTNIVPDSDCSSMDQKAIESWNRLLQKKKQREKSERSKGGSRD